VKRSDMKELTEKELAKGKNKLRIFNSRELLPWSDVYARISAGVPIEHIAQKYGMIRAITLWAEHDGISVVQEISDVVDSEIIQRRKMNAVEQSNPDVAKTLREVVNEYAPDVARDLALLTASMIRKGQSVLNEDDCSTNDMKNIAQAVQTMTDTVEVSERFSTNAGNGNISIAVEGFKFEIDNKPVLDVDVVKDNGTAEIAIIDDEGL